MSAKTVRLNNGCRDVTFDCDRCGQVIAKISLAGVIARKHQVEIEMFVSDAHRRQHEEEDRANGAKHS